jgi:hypothetical protein
MTPETPADLRGPLFVLGLIALTWAAVSFYQIDEEMSERYADNSNKAALVQSGSIESQSKEASEPLSATLINGNGAPLSADKVNADTEMTEPAQEVLSLPDSAVSTEAVIQDYEAQHQVADAVGVDRAQIDRLVFELDSQISYLSDLRDQLEAMKNDE